MAFDEGLAERIRGLLNDRHDVVEKKMFGGLCFMVRGHMTAGINGDELMVRVGKDRYESAMAQPHAREMDFTGRSLKGFVYVGTDGFNSDDDLAAWVGRGIENAESLPEK
jgi:TfoX/Sxy family transcriptional regulator of competence genes